MNRRSLLKLGAGAVGVQLLPRGDAERSLLHQELYLAPTFIAHRGASLTYPENTALSIKQAYVAGADIAECDIRFGLNNTPVLCHDPDILRVTNATLPLKVSALTWNQLNVYDWGYPKMFGTKFKGTKPTGIWTALALAKQYSRELLAEVKDPFTPVTFDRLMHEIDVAEATTYVILYSFIKSNVDMIRKLRPDIRTALCEDTPPTGMMRTNESLVSIGGIYAVSQSLVTADRMSYWGAGDIRRWVWTLDNPTSWPVFANLGADGIITGNVAYQQWRMTR